MENRVSIYIDGKDAGTEELRPWMTLSELIEEIAQRENLRYFMLVTTDYNDYPGGVVIYKQEPNERIYRELILVPSDIFWQYLSRVHIITDEDTIEYYNEVITLKEEELIERFMKRPFELLYYPREDDDEFRQIYDSLKEELYSTLSNI